MAEITKEQRGVLIMIMGNLSAQPQNAMIETYLETLAEVTGYSPFGPDTVPEPTPDPTGGMTIKKGEN